jgi:hypothetical protein
MMRETKCKLSGPLDGCYKEQWYQSELKNDDTPLHLMA